MTLKRVGVASCMKMFGGVYFLIGLLVGVLLALMSLLRLPALRCTRVRGHGPLRPSIGQYFVRKP